MCDQHQLLHALKIPVLSALANWAEPPPSLAQHQSQRMSSLFVRKHLVPQLGHSDHKPAQCCGICVNRQIDVVPGRDVISWALQGAMTSLIPPGKCQSSQAQQSTVISQ